LRPVLPPTYFLAALVGMMLLHVLWPIARYLAFPLTLLGLVPLATGIALNVVADRAFHRHQTTVKPFEHSSALVTGFPFTVSRNPMYLGMTLILVGVAFLLGTVTPAFPALAFPIVMDVRFVRVEERMLRDAFGAEWEQYRARVRRWL
jgi:protein-S-isoprenylcysteine O-methyltransferase Ste14